MPSDEILRLDRELMDNLRHTGTVADRERLVLENLRRKEATAGSLMRRHKISGHDVLLPADARLLSKDDESTDLGGCY